MMDLTPYRDELMQTARQLLEVDSPTGYCRDVIALIQQKAQALGERWRRA